MRMPPSSRNRLDWYVFEAKPRGNWMLVLPNYYADLFAQQESLLLRKAHNGFKPSRRGNTQVAQFSQLSGADVEQIRAFIEAYQRIVILAPNEHIAANFTDELDGCIALDYNLAKTALTQERTKIGDLEYKAKYSRDEFSMDKLVGEMARALHRIPIRASAWPFLLTYIPPQQNKPFHLPKILAEKLSVLRRRPLILAPESLVHVALACSKPSFKNARLAEKLDRLNTIMSPSQIALSKPVKGADIIVLDDLYQSGATLWSFARCLKNLGASSVYGVVCVKSWRDTDNQ